LYDAVVVGGRCAGAPTAMLLARKGYRVLVVERDTFPSDIMSTHYIHLPGIARLENWGLLDRLVATGCPPITSATMHLGDLLFQPPSLSELVPGIPELTLWPRRLVMDKLLINGASACGAEFSPEF